MRIALVFPRLWRQVHGLWPPLGLASLATVLKNAGEDVKIFDSSFDDSFDRLKSELKNFSPELVGIYTLTEFFRAAQELVPFAKSLGAKTVLGAAHPTVLPEQTMREIPELDFIIRGEGEGAILQLVAALRGEQDFSGVAGLGFRRNGSVALNPMPETPLDVDQLPVPDRSLFEHLDKYLRSRAINLHVTRGCPFSCSFCQPTLKMMFGRKLRYRSPGLVVEEIKQLNQKYQVREFFFHDDIFTVNHEWLRELVAKINQAGLRKGFRYVVNSRVDTFDEEVAALLKEMGVHYVLFGLESGSQEVLDRLKKGTTLEQAYQAFALCRKSGFRTHAYILLAGPGETKDTLMLTEKMLERLKPDTVHISICTPLPGTGLEKEAREQGLVNLDDYSDMDYYLESTSSGKLPLKLAGLTYREVLDTRERILKKRRWFVMRDNLLQLFRDFRYDPSPSKFIFQLSFYRKMQHYFG
jgi:anaerobic magnesium-protoporphyrin IX monomethyl ester cyclase